MPGYVKYMKDLVTRKKIVSFEPTNNVHHYSVIASRLLVEKKEDPVGFTIPCTIRSFNFSLDLCDLGENINIILLVMFKKLGFGVPKSTLMRASMADQTVKKPLGILCDLLVNVASFIFLVDFLIHDCEVDFQVPIILGNPFLSTGRALDNIELRKIKFKINVE